MLNSLHIKNFRNLKKFKVSSLERVNLITGKNNTGKSTILEAIELYNYSGRYDILLKQLKKRGILSEKENNIEEQSFRGLQQLFHNFDYEEDIEIGINQEKLIIKLVYYIEKIVQEGNTHYHKTTILDKKGLIINGQIKSGLMFKKGDEEVLIKFDLEYPPYSKLYLEKFSPCYFVSSHSVQDDFNSKLWDKIALTNKETNVINALKIIDSSIERLTFVEKHDERSPVVKVKGETLVLPLKFMGDGINRILTIILAMVNAEGGTLLIDEFENGLHHTVQEQLWKMIFLLAEELDIQVFATTHSEDCIRGFENVLNDYNINTNGKLIRLDRKGDKIVQVEFDKEELKVATDFDIEIR